jgi:menaquinone-dependent protoporphyrinogen oxidase
MRVLVAVASKHGSTMQIGAAIGAGLIDHGFKAEVETVESVITVEPYDAVILGSAVYMGRWMESARSFIARFEEDLRVRPVWLFSSGPIGDPPKPAGGPREVVDLAARIEAREHRVFAGQLDKHELGISERAVAAVAHSPEGDFRPWDAVEAWTNQIVGELRAIRV